MKNSSCKYQNMYIFLPDFTSYDFGLTYFLVSRLLVIKRDLLFEILFFKKFVGLIFGNGNLYLQVYYEKSVRLWNKKQFFYLELIKIYGNIAVQKLTFFSFNVF